MGFGLNGFIDFQVGSAYQLPCWYKSMDVTTCINTLHHLQDPIAFFHGRTSLETACHLVNYQSERGRKDP